MVDVEEEEYYEVDDIDVELKKFTKFHEEYHLNVHRTYYFGLIEIYFDEDVMEIFHRKNVCVYEESIRGLLEVEATPPGVNTMFFMIELMKDRIVVILKRETVAWA